MAIVYLSLGSNLEDRVGYIQQATSLLGGTDGVTIVRTSAFYESEPVEMNSENWFVNAVVEAKTTLPPQHLLEQCQRIERQLGRKSKSGDYQDRTIDIDILLYGKEVIDTDTLTVPHNKMHQRAFALVPLLELIPDTLHPKLQKTMSDLHEELANPEIILLYGTRG